MRSGLPVGPLVTYALVAACSLALFAVTAQLRPVNDDEGYFLLGAQQLLAGHRPYRDFFFPQMPLGLVFYAAWQALVGSSIVAARFLTAVFASASTVLVFHGARRQGGPWAGAIGALVFASHDLVLRWATVAKPLGFSVFFPVAVLVLATSRPVGRAVAIVAGGLCALAAGCRLTLLPLFAFALLALALGASNSSERRAGVRRLSVGFLIGGVFVVPFLLGDVAASWFDNVTFHSLRSPGEGHVKDFPQKLLALEQLLGLADGYRIAAAQTVVLLALGAFGALRNRSTRLARVGTLSAALGLGLLAFLPSPVWIQYFVVVVGPCALLAPLAIVPAPLEGGTPTGRHLGWLAATGALIGGYVLLGAMTYGTIVAAPLPLRPADVDSVGNFLAAVTVDGDFVAAAWPPYLVASERAPHPAALSQFAWIAGPRMPAAMRARYHVALESDVESAIVKGEVSACVLFAPLDGEAGSFLASRGWKGRFMAGVSVFVAPRNSR